MTLISLMVPPSRPYVYLHPTQWRHGVDNTAQPRLVDGAEALHHVDGAARSSTCLPSSHPMATSRRRHRTALSRWRGWGTSSRWWCRPVVRTFSFITTVNLNYPEILAYILCFTLAFILNSQPLAPCLGILIKNWFELRSLPLHH